jgi:hypothetical protein
MITVTEDFGGYMPKREKERSDLMERLKVLGSVAFYALCGLALTALLFLGPYGWVFTIVGVLVLVLLFLFWPRVTSLFRRKPKLPKRAKIDE